MVALAGEEALARNYHPSSGRRLRYDHWLTCELGEQDTVRTDPPFFNAHTPESEVAAYIPEYRGNFQFNVQDTWQEWVTHSGSSCSHCGESCRGSGSNRSCSCNSCSWEELETFYRDWSTQNVAWHVKWNQDPEYRKKFQDWQKASEDGHTPRAPTDLADLLKFDPNRPLEYYLFPGEIEQIQVSNGIGFFSGGESIGPEVQIKQPRYDYSKGIQIMSDMSGRSGRGVDCDDRDFHIDASVTTGPRLSSTATPNSIEFRKGWINDDVNGDNILRSEDAKFNLTDLGEMRYENQNRVDHYKDTKVQIAIWQVHRAYWYFSHRVGRFFDMENNQTRIDWHDKEAVEVGKAPPPATYELMSSDLRQTPLWDAEFHLIPQTKYEVCARMVRLNNVYYNSTWMHFWTRWSDYNCAVFTYDPGKGEDRRGFLRRIQDGFLARFIPLF